MHARSPSRVMVLLNVLAGAGENAQDDIRETMISAFGARDIAAEIVSVRGAELWETSSRAAHKAARHEIDAVIAAGGDGTIGTVASALAGTGVALGIVPLGTVNHFAKDLGIPLELSKAVETIAAGHSVAVDVADVNGHVFVNNSSIGVYPYMVLDRERRRRRAGLHKWLAMGLAGMRMLRVFPVRRLRINVAGHIEPWRTPCLFVGNNKYELNLTSIRRRQRLDGGELWLYILRQQTRISLLWLTFRSLLGLTDAERDLRVFAAKRADVSTRTSRIAVALDGEVSVMQPPLHYRIRPGALRVYVPALESPQSGV